MKHLLINIFLFSLIFSQMPLKEFSDWNILQDDEIWVEIVVSQGWNLQTLRSKVLS